MRLSTSGPADERALRQSRRDICVGECWAGSARSLDTTRWVDRRLRSPGAPMVSQAEVCPDDSTVVTPERPMAHVVFDLEVDEDGWPPVASERVWAFAVGDDLYEIDNAPWFVPGVAAGDVARAVPTTPESDPVFVNVDRFSDHSSVRVICFRAGPLAGDLGAWPMPSYRSASTPREPSNTESWRSTSHQRLIYAQWCDSSAKDLETRAGPGRSASRHERWKRSSSRWTRLSRRSLLPLIERTHLPMSVRVYMRPCTA